MGECCEEGENTSRRGEGVRIHPADLVAAAVVCSR